MQAFINTHSGSARVKQATDIIDECRKKLELKDEKNAQLYYDLGYYKSAAVAFATLSDDYPDSENSDRYKLNEIRAYFKYAEMSISDKQVERFEKVIAECAEFEQRFTDSHLIAEVNNYKTETENNLKKLQNEQIKETTQR